ncbi:MAG: (Fe-S)-binding protein [Planctomycetota bacterium]|nr:(Fe-S)-binding protein [Planctomycetota bacterium]
MKIAFFASCLIDQFRPSAGLAAVEVLERCGCEVVFDQRQTCCGQPAFNSGFKSEARSVCSRAVKLLDEQLEQQGCEAIVCPSGSCAAMLHHAVQLLGGAEAQMAQRVAARVYELGAFLVDVLGCTDLEAAWSGRVTWHDACHGLRDLGIRDQPRQLLSKVRGLELVEAKTCDRCCGFGGTFSVSMPGISLAMADEKLDELETLGVEAVVSGDASCLMQLEGRLRERGSSIKGLHLAEILASRESDP